MAGTAVWALGWTDVDPARHPYDAGLIHTIVASALTERAAAPRGEDDPGQATEDAVDRALLAAVGPWLAGWRWTASEPGGGGPVRVYCCAPHSLNGSRAEQAATVSGAVAAWRTCLETLAREYASLAAEARALEDAAPHAASVLLPLVLEWTGADDAWYATFQRILVWALEAQGVDSARAEALVAKAIAGHFHSWIEPEDDVRDAVFAALRDGAAAPWGPATDDATAQWLARRGQVRWDRGRYYRPGVVRHDGHERFIEDVDARRDVRRAARLRHALKLARRDAARGVPLDLARLTSWQEVVLHGPAPFRDRDAFAHEGRERYGYAPDLAAHFAACLAEANDPSVSVIARAARVYLDICFVHPFVDGNARAARLALDFVLAREGLALHAAGPVFLVARRVTDGDEVYRFMWIVDYLAGPRAT